MSRLGELLLRDQIISPEQLQRAQEESKKSGERLGNTLIKVGAIQEDDLTQFLSKQYGVPAINLSEFEIDHDVITLLPREAGSILSPNRCSLTPCYCFTIAKGAARICRRLMGVT